MSQWRGAVGPARRVCIFIFRYVNCAPQTPPLVRCVCIFIFRLIHLISTDDTVVVPGPSVVTIYRAGVADRHGGGPMAERAGAPRARAERGGGASVPERGAYEADAKRGTWKGPDGRKACSETKTRQKHPLLCIHAMCLDAMFTSVEPLAPRAGKRLQDVTTPTRVGTAAGRGASEPLALQVARALSGVQHTC